MSKSLFEKTYSPGWDQYELVDAGGGQKLERWGEIYTIRPERQAYFKSGMPFTEWEKIAHWKFIESKGQKGTWKSIQKAPKQWTISALDCTFLLELTQFKHIGLFPEQYVNWKKIRSSLGPNKKMLNLFAYTGASSLMAKKAGAETLHVDSVKQLIQWAKTNMEKSGLSDVKWVLEDALKFAHREVKRGNRYDLIQMDPPAWGLGAKGEKWKLENKIDELIELAHTLLNKGGVLILNTYSPRLELDELNKRINQHFNTSAGSRTQLWQKSTSGKKLYYGDLVVIQK